MSAKQRDVGGLVVRCGAVSGRLSYLLDWMKAQETIKEPSASSPTTIMEAKIDA